MAVPDPCCPGYSGDNFGMSRLEAVLPRAHGLVIGAGRRDNIGQEVSHRWRGKLIE